MNIINKLKWRYATKKFDPSKRISEEKLAVLKESFNLTATSYGLQPVKMIVIGNKKVKQQLVPFTFGQRQVQDASHVLVLCIEEKVGASYIEEHFARVEHIQQTKREILEPFERFLINHFSEKNPEDIYHWMAKQAYLALGNLLTVCAVEDIDACPIEGFEPEKYDAFLELQQKGLKSVVVIAVGYRAEDDMFAALKKVRRGTDQVVIEIK